MEETRYTLVEARALIPWMMEATAEAERDIRNTQDTIEDVKTARLRIREIIHHWAGTVHKLGGLPKQPFTIDFNSGSDYFCWEYPEKDIYYRHGYQNGYAGRRPIEEES